MSYRKLRSFIQENSSFKNLIIVSNREPYIHKKTAAGIKVDKPAGGLTAAMDEVMRALGGSWVAWGSGSGDRARSDAKSCVQVPPGNPLYTLKRVWLTNDEVENFYHGYSNSVLWPLCHITLDRVYYRKVFWEDYKKANADFADAVLDVAESNSLVWIHDYHLCIVPKILRTKRPKLSLAHFWHIPWPDHSVFRICPQTSEVLSALLCNDILCFQLPLFSRNFLECVKQTIFDAEVDLEHSTVTYKGHVTKVMAFPISVDFEKFSSLAQDVKTIKNMQLIRQRYNFSGKLVGVGVDRLEYTKALVKRLRAIDFFFARYKEYRGRFTFLQIAVPTRMEEPYLSYKYTVERMVRKINRKYSSGSWSPIMYRDIKADHEDLVVFYRLADIAIISSIHDGMNLVAKEFVSSRTDKKGVLVLSEFAGAAEELEGALLVNPYDIEEFSESIKRALEMSAREKTSRMNTLRRQVKENDIYLWIAEILSELSSVAYSRHECRYLFDHSEIIPRDNIFLFLDYDGTLTPIVSDPDKAVLSRRVRSHIKRLNEMYRVAIVSGRSIEDIKKKVSIDSLIYAGNHGAEIWEGDRLVSGQRFLKSRQSMKRILRELNDSLSPVKGFYLEDKGITASIHYRNVGQKDFGMFFDTFWSIADRYDKLFRITSGKKVFEIRPVGIWNKGDAVKWILKKYGPGQTPIYIGDDTTDEDAFKVIKGKGIGVCVGSCIGGDYYLRNQKEVRIFLHYLGSGKH